MTQAIALWCRRCGKPMRLDGGPDVESELQRTVHMDPDPEKEQESCADGELGIPVDWNPAVRM